MRWLGLAFVLACSEPRYVIFDDDLGTPDGTLALLYLVAEPGTQVLGITCTFGSQPLDVCMSTGKRILEAIEHTEIPLVRGARTPDDYLQATQATDFVLRETRAGKVELIAAGTLTNLASYLQLGAQVTTLHVLLTGIEYDTAATDVVLAHAAAMRVYPKEVLEAVTFDEEDYEALRRAGSPLSRFVLDQLGTEQMPFLPRSLTGLGVALDPYFRRNEERTGLVLSAGRVQRSETAPVRDVVFGFNDEEKFKRRFRERLVR